MYQFTKTAIINSNVDVSSGLTKFTGAATSFVVLHEGSFRKANIVSVYKTPGAAGQTPISSLVVSLGSGVTAGMTDRLEIDVILDESAKNSDYASYKMYFHKPAIFEITHGATYLLKDGVTSVTVSDATTAAKVYVDLINRYNDKLNGAYLTATENGSGTITLTGVSNYQSVITATITEETTSTNTMISPAYTFVAASTITRKGNIGFGNYDWMIRRVSVPTLDKFRWVATLQDERPEIGAIYDEYVIQYKVSRENEDPGIYAGGYSLTAHVFYVKQGTTSTAFEAAITTTFPGMLTNSNSLTAVITGDTTLSLAAGAQTFTVSGLTAPVTWTSSVTATATVTGTGTSVQVTPVAINSSTPTVLTATANGVSATISVTVIA